MPIVWTENEEANKLLDTDPLANGKGVRPPLPEPPRHATLGGFQLGGVMTRRSRVNQATLPEVTN